MVQRGGYWWVGQAPTGVNCDDYEDHMGLAGAEPLMDQNGNLVPADQARPGWTFNPAFVDFLTTPNISPYLALYDGDRVKTGLCVQYPSYAETTAGCSSGPGGALRPTQRIDIYGNIHTTILIHVVRPVAPGAPERLVDLPGTVVYRADRSNRVVEADGLFHREQLVNGKWVRSISYGANDEAKRRAAWNAYYVSMGLLVGPPGEGFPEGLDQGASGVSIASAVPQRPCVSPLSWLLWRILQEITGNHT